MDDTTLQVPRASRPVELDSRSRLHPTASGSPVRGGQTLTLGKSVAYSRTDALQGTAGVSVSFGGVRNPGESTETLRTLSGQAERESFGPGEALPGDQEGRLSTLRGLIRKFRDELHGRCESPRA